MKLSGGGGGWPYRHLGDIIDIPGGHVRLGLRAIIQSVCGHQGQVDFKTV